MAARCHEVCARQPLHFPRGRAGAGNARNACTTVSFHCSVFLPTDRDSTRRHDQRTSPAASWSCQKRARRKPDILSPSGAWVRACTSPQMRGRCVDAHFCLKVAAPRNNKGEDVQCRQPREELASSAARVCWRLVSGHIFSPPVVAPPIMMATCFCDASFITRRPSSGMRAGKSLEERMPRWQRLLVASSLFPLLSLLQEDRYCLWLGIRVPLYLFVKIARIVAQ